MSLESSVRLHAGVKDVVLRAARARFFVGI